MSWSDALQYFESTDLLRDRYQDRHERDLSSGKAFEVADHFRQGREFFATAAGSSLLVRPLLLYYGVLALSRGLILFLQPQLRESGLRKAHGLRAGDWQATLARGMRKIGELEVRSEGGTFTQLAETTCNLERDWKTGEEVRGADSIPADTTFLARDVWARIPGLGAAYGATMEGPHLSHVYDLSTSVGYRISLEVKRREGPLPNAEEFRHAYGIPESIEVNRLDPYGDGPILHAYLPWENDWSFPALLWTNNGHLTAPYPGGLRLSQISTLYLSAYITGMLVRYYPTRWAALVHRNEGDAVLPLIRKATDIVEGTFPPLLARLLVPEER